MSGERDGDGSRRNQLDRNNQALDEVHVLADRHGGRGDAFDGEQVRHETAEHEDDVAEAARLSGKPHVQHDEPEEHVHAEKQQRIQHGPRGAEHRSGVPLLQLHLRGREETRRSRQCASVNRASPVSICASPARASGR